MSELLPCPFCGWGAPSWHVEHFAYDFEEYAVHCGNCDAESAMLRTREEAAAAWNRRTTLPAAPAPRYAHRNGETETPEVAELESEVEKITLHAADQMQRIVVLEQQRSDLQFAHDKHCEIMDAMEKEIDELLNERATLTAQLEWEPLPDGEYDSFMYVDNGGKLLGIFAGDDYSDWYATHDLPDNIRLCRRVREEQP